MLSRRATCRIFPSSDDDKTTSKVRPVLDGAAQYRGKCLNDAIYVGPKVINDLDVVLTRFRRHQIAVGGDVSEMFLRIFLYPEGSEISSDSLPGVTQGSIDPLPIYGSSVR